MGQTGRTVSFWLFIVLIMLLFVFQYDKGNMKQAQKLSYSDFISDVQAGKVKSVVVHLDSDVAQEYELSGTLGDGSDYDLLAPSRDPDLFRILRQGKVQITTQGPQVWAQLIKAALFEWGPFIFLIVIWFIFLNRMQGGGAGGALNFGKMRAKVWTGGQSKVTFADVAGIDEAKEELKEIIDFLKDPGKFQKLGGKIPKGVLLLGPPGTGKTLLARAVAGEAGRPFFSMSGSDFVEMFVGVGASRVRDLFEQGKKNAPCIIFIDEMDAVGRHRGAGLGGGHDEREQTLNALLVEMDGFEATKGVILVAATNRPDVLDPALTRPGRFDRQIVVDRPDLVGREGILKVHTRNVVLGTDVDMKVLARRTPGFSGADLANLVNEAALLAARRDKKAVGMEELEDAVDRVMAGPERKSRVMSEREKKVIAYHESGHALVAKLTPNVDPVHKVSIIPRGYGVLGYVMQLPTEDRFVVQKEEILSKITVSLGGRASEEIIFGDISTGASNDLEKATETAHRMVMEFGMSEKLGRVTYGRKEREVFLGRDLMRDKDYSEKTAQMIDNEVKRIVESCYKRAKTLLTRNKPKLVKLAETLLEKEIVEGDELDSLLGLTPRPAPGSAAPAPTPA